MPFASCFTKRISDDMNKIGKMECVWDRGLMEKYVKQNVHKSFVAKSDGIKESDVRRVKEKHERCVCCQLCG